MSVGYDAFVAPAGVLLVGQQLFLKSRSVVASQWCGTSEHGTGRKKCPLSERDGEWPAAAACDGVFVGVVWGQKGSVGETLFLFGFFFFCCRLWMMETITTGCHATQCITGACYRKFQLCYHAQYSQRRLIHIWWGWNGGVFCYKAVNGIWNANADRKL